MSRDVDDGLGELRTTSWKHDPPANLATDFCPQCYRHRPLEQFLSTKGDRYVRRCKPCRDRYGNWATMTVAQRRAAMRAKPRTGNGYTAVLVIGTKNRKLGGIPVSMTDMRSCPDACAFRDQGCYAEFGKVRWFWERVAEDRGQSWREFCDVVTALPDGTLWRHNEAGDLPGLGDELDPVALGMLVRANRGKKGFTFTHKPLTRAGDVELIRKANAAGFTINLSADSLEHADARYDLDAGPVALVLPTSSPARLETPKGRKVIACLYETHGMTCADCTLCAQVQRKTIVGFRAHGQAKAIVSDLVQLRKKPTPAAARRTA